MPKQQFLHMIGKVSLLAGLTLGLSACGASDLKLPEVELPSFSLTRDVPAPANKGTQRITREAIPVNRQIIVRAGDTIYALAARYQVTPQSLIADNDLQAPYALQQGQSLKITPSREHIVRPIDSLFTISQRYAVSQYHLAEINELSAPYELTVGQALLIPDAHDFSVLDSSKGVDSAAYAKPAPQAVITEQITPTDPVKPTAPAKEKKNFVAPAFASGDAFTWPLEGEIILDYGPAGKGIHNDGVNIAADEGAVIQVAAPGTVAYIGRNLKSFGSMVLVKHDGGYITAYAHLDDVRVAEGDVLGAGQAVGTVGQTGRVTSPQLHFEVRQSRQPINPHDIINS